MAYVDYKNSANSLAIEDYFGEIASQSEMLSLVDEFGRIPQKGDWCFRTDVSSEYVVTGADSTQLSSWTARGAGGSVDWASILNKPSTFTPSTHTHLISDVTNLQTTLDGKQASLPSGNSTKYLRGDLTMQTLDKSAVGLSNVDNTSDATKNSASATLTNKTISGADNTLSNIPQSAITNLTTDLGNKQATITGAATTIDTEDLTASRAVISNASGKIAVSTVTDTELGYVSGVTSAIQTQLGNKQNLDATLTALAAFNTNGILTQTAADTFTARSIAVDGAAYLTVSNGNGVSGNPTLNINTSTVETLGTNQTITGIKTFSTAPVLNALPTGTAVASAATASTLVARDSNAIMRAANINQGYTTTATAAGTTTLTVSSNRKQYFTGSTTQTVVLPLTSTLELGQEFEITNNSSGSVTVQSSGANSIVVLTANQTGVFTCILTSGTTAASWNFRLYATTVGGYSAPTLGTTSIASGATVTNISGLTLTDSQNTVSTPTTTSGGYLGTPVNSQSAAYTLVMSDAGKTILHPSTDANARTFTIPANSSVAYPIGTVLTFINETSQVVTIAITTDTMTLVNTTTTGSRSLAQNGIATAVKITSTKWIISGNGLT